MTEDLMVNFCSAEPEKFAYEIDFDSIVLKLGILTRPEEFIPDEDIYIEIAPLF